MRKSVLAIAAAAAVFALTASGAGAAGLLTSTAATVNLKTLAKQAVTLNDCEAAAVGIAYTLETVETDVDFGEVVSATVTATAETSALLDDCDTVELSTDDGTSYLTGVTFEAASGAASTFTRVATVTFTTPLTTVGNARAKITPTA